MYHHPNGNSPSSPESVSSSYIGSPGPSGVIQHTVMPIFQPDPCMVPIRTEKMLPYLHILNQPQSKFRFRYASEMTGTHGCLMAESRDRNKKECIQVQLVGCHESEAIVRCTLVTNSKDPVPHVHKLGGEGQNVNDGDYQDIVVSASKNDWIATFSGLTIIHTAKKQVSFVVERRLRNEKGNIPLNRSQEQQLKDEADKIAITMDLHSVKLKFQAFVRRHDCLMAITQPTYSHAIHNLKSTQAGDLRIVRIDKVNSPCTGHEEIFIFVEKVNKKDIKIRFFETDDNDEEIWSADADFSELDVHHQYAIAFKTPPYRDQKIEEAVNVWFQLYRPSNGSTSAPKAFTYTPKESVVIGGKRPRPSKPSVNVSDPSDASAPLPRSVSGQSQKQVPTLQPSYLPQNGSGHQGPMELAFNEEDLLPGFSPAQSAHPITNPQSFSTENFWLNEPAVQSNIQPFIHTGMIQHPVQHHAPPIAQDDFSNFSMSIGDGANGFPEKALADLSFLLDGSEWAADYEGSYSIDACVTSDSTQPKDQLQIKTPSRDMLPPQITDSSLTRATMLNNFVFRMAAALRMYTGSGDTTHNLNRFLHLMAMKDDNGDNALHCALTYDQVDVVQHILKTVPNNEYGLRFINAFNNSKLTPLHLCVKKNLTELIPLFIQCGADPFLLNITGDTVVHVAAADKILEDSLKLLLEHGTSDERRKKLNLRNYAGFSPLHLAVIDGNLKAVELLLTHGSNVNLVEAKSGKSALHLAVQQHSKDIVALLLRERTVDVNAQSYDGNTALHVAVMEDLPDICMMLTNAGADPNIVNFAQQSGLSDDEVPIDHTSVRDEDSVTVSKGASAFDMASLNASILEILMQPKEVPLERNTKDPSSPTASESNSCFTDSGFDVSESQLNGDVIKEIASYLDASKGWEKLADSLELLSSVRCALDQQPSPTAYLLSNLDLWEIPSHVVLEKLHLLQFKQAAKLLEEYLGL